MAKGSLLRFCTQARSSGVCLSVPGLLHFTGCTHMVTNSKQTQSPLTPSDIQRQRVPGNLWQFEIRMAPIDFRHLYAWSPRRCGLVGGDVSLGMVIEVSEYWHHSQLDLSLSHTCRLKSQLSDTTPVPRLPACLLCCLPWWHELSPAETVSPK